MEGALFLASTCSGSSIAIFDSDTMMILAFVSSIACLSFRILLGKLEFPVFNWRIFMSSSSPIFPLMECWVLFLFLARISVKPMLIASVTFNDKTSSLLLWLRVDEISLFFYILFFYLFFVFFVFLAFFLLFFIFLVFFSILCFMFFYCFFYLL